VRAGGVAKFGRVATFGIEVGFWRQAGEPLGWEYVRVLRSRRFVLIAAGVIALACGGVEVGSASASSKIKQCGHVDGTVAVTVTKGNVSCKTARAVGRAWDRNTTVPDGFRCRTHRVQAGSGRYGVCKKGSSKSVTVNPE
jgi:hypothetical protein